MALAAGLVHLAQVQVHAEEDLSFGTFFAVVGALQVAGALYLVRPVGPERLVRGVFAFGVVGSLATIGIWAASRTLGLPFGAEPGEPEEVGLADAAADLFELFTALLLSMWLRHGDPARFRWRRWAVGGSTVALGLAGLWLALRALEILDPDPRLVLQPELTDTVAVAFLLLTSALFAGLAIAPRRSLRLAGASVVGGLLVLELLLVAFTIPARGGQNVECRYAPLAEDSGLSHARPPEPVHMDVGQTRSVVALLLVACGDAPVELAAIEPIRVVGSAVQIERIAIDRTRTQRGDKVRSGPSVTAVPVGGVVMVPGAGRYPVVVDVRAVGPGRVDTTAFRVDYVFSGEKRSFGFASFTAFCVGHEACEQPR